MPFGHGIAAKFYWHDLDMTPYLESIEPAAERSMGEGRPLAAGRVARVAGFKDFRLALAGLYDGAAAGSHEFAWARFNESVQRAFSYLPQGDALSGVAYCGINNLGSESQEAGDDILRMPVAVVASDCVERCRILCPLASKAADGNGASIDNGAATANGGIGIVHCTALDVAATVDVTIEHSINDADWDTLVTFTQLAATGSERIVVAEGTTVRQYLRAVWDVTGGAATIFVAFGRR